MTMFNNILFPVDFSERCSRTATYVASVVRKFHGELTLLHAFDLHDAFGYGAASSTVAYGAAMEVLKEHRKRAVAAFCQDELQGLPVKRQMDAGEAADCITANAAAHATDLIIMPTHGRGRLYRLLLGSVTSKVLHDSDCPVWTTAHAETTASPDIKSIICAVDLLPDSVHLIRAAGEIAAEYSAVLRLIHAIPTPDAAGEEAQGMGLGHFLFDTAMRQIAERQEEAGTQFEVSVKAGNIPAVIRQEALHYHADLVIVDRGRLREFLGSLKSSVYEIIRESPCPVLSF
jgi:nucleotide-binding universal stress UspA family protein